MGLRDKVKRVINKFSGEYSQPAPTELKPYERPGVPDENAQVVMARLNRPGAAEIKQK